MQCNNKSTIMKLRNLFFHVAVLICIVTTGCKEKSEKIKYEYGAFPDSVYALTGINSDYDDYNITFNVDAMYNLTASFPVIFSSNRTTSGGSFDFVYGFIGYRFDRMTGEFELKSEISQEDFYQALTTKFNTAGNDYGPNRLFCSHDGFEYMFGASDVTGSGLDLKFSRYTPYISSIPSIPDPLPATAFNSSFNDAYICFNNNFDTAYFCSDRGGDFDIYYLAKPSGMTFQNWLTTAGNSPVLVNSINTDANEKFPYVSGKIMVFASDRADGSGGYDLYYSILSGGTWSSPVNMGPDINTEHNEYRPVIGNDNYFENRFLIFSSDRPDGKGGYDLYFGPLTIE